MSKKRTAVFAALATAAITVAGATPAFATNEINFAECQFVRGQGYFSFHGQAVPPFPPVYRCWANAGDVNVDSEYVWGFSSGDNAGWFEYEPGDGSRYRHYFGKWESNEYHYGYVGPLHIN